MSRNRFFPTTGANPDDLTEAEVAWLKSKKADPEIKAFVGRQTDDFGVAISVYRKVAAAATAKTEAILATRELSKVQGDFIDVSDVRQALGAALSDKQQLQAENDHLKDTVMQLTAGSAMAVHSDD